MTLKTLDMFLADVGQLRQAFLGDPVSLAELLEAPGEPNADVVHVASMLA
jgi:hypothetical protein